jgi:hypothetical protein
VSKPNQRHQVESKAVDAALLAGRENGMCAFFGEARFLVIPRQLALAGPGRLDWAMPLIERTCVARRLRPAFACSNEQQGPVVDYYSV